MTTAEMDEDERLAWWKADTLLTEAHDAVTRALKAERMVPAARVRLTRVREQIECAMEAQREGRPK